MQPEQPVINPNPFVFDTDGVSLIATHEGQRVIGKVSPHAMALASPVWKKFFYPPWRESRSQAEHLRDMHATKKLHQFEPSVGEVDFSEDAGPGLLILLRITHLQFTKVPPSLSLAELSDVAILCDKYDCIHIVQPWSKAWLRQCFGFNETGSKRYDQKLWAHFVFGVEEQFQKTLRKAVLHREFTNTFQATTALSAEPPQQMIWPPGVEEHVDSLRKQALSNILDKVQSCLKQFSKKDQLKCTFKLRSCDTSIYGALLQEFEQCGVYSHAHGRPAVDSIKLSVSSLVDRLVGLDIGVSHDGCVKRLKLFATFKIANLEIPSINLDAHTRYMEAQRKKLNPNI